MAIPGSPTPGDSDSHLLPLGSATLPGTVTDPTLRGGFLGLRLGGALALPPAFGGGIPGPEAPAAFRKRDKKK